MAFPDDPRDLEVGFAFGSTASANPTGLTYEVVAPGTDDDDPGDVLGTVTIARGRIENAGTTDATKISTAVRNDDGQYSPENVTGDHYGGLRNGTPMQVRVDVGSGMVVRGRAAQPDWNPRWDGPDINDRLPIEALGVLSQLGRDRDTESALKRALSSRHNSAYFAMNYWPMEDGTAASQFGSAVSHGFPMIVTSVGFAATVGPDGSTSLPVFDAATALDGPVHWPSGALGGFYAAVLIKWPSSTPPSAATTLLEVHCKGGTAARWVYAANATDTSLTGYDADGAVVFSDTNADATTAFGLLADWCVLEIRSSDATFGGTLSATITRVSDDTATVSLGGVGTGHTSGTVTNVAIPASSELDGAAFGHMTMAPLAPIDFTDGARGFTGEAASTRIQRLLVEDGVAFSITAGDSTLMGVQPPASLVALLRDCEAADHGILYELADGRLGYKPLRSLYNLASFMDLDYGTEADPGNCDVYPVSDDRDKYNVVTVTRRNGASVTAEQVDGPIGSDESTGVGPRPLPLTLSLAEDSQVADHAGWVKHETTVDKPRFVVTIDLRNNQDLIADWLACDIGSRITVANPSAKHCGPNDLDLIIVGYVETLGADVWVAVIYCEPYARYDIGTFGVTPIDATTRRFDTLGSTLTADVDAGTDSSFQVTIAAGHKLWTLKSASWTGLQVEAGGVIWQVSSITGSSSPQTINVVQAPANGVTKTVPANTQVRVAPRQRARFGL